MARQNEIEEALRQIEGGQFQTIANQVIYRKFDLDSYVPYGSHFGTNKTTTGIPDTYSITRGAYYLVAFTTSTCDIESKLHKDATDCLDVEKTAIPQEKIAKIILCHTFPRLSPKIASKIHAIDSRIEIIGPETIAMELDRYYPALAHISLGVSLGKNSFVDADAFIRKQAVNAFSTDQSSRLISRDNELKSTTETIGLHDITLIKGSAGCGKTKLALEACKAFCAKENWDFLILESKYSRNADSDIDLILPESRNLLIMVDDANEQTTLDHLLSVCSANNNLKIVMTVRSLSAFHLIAKIKEYANPALINLAPLSKNDASSILETEYGIANRTLRKRIIGIADGNLRVAIMAALSITRGNGTAFSEPYDLLDSYLRPMLNVFSEKQLLIIEATSIFPALDVEHGNPCFKYLTKLGMDKTEVVNCANILNEHEIVSIIKSPDGIVGVRIEEQNLRDYYACRHFAKQHVENFSDFIVENIAEPEIYGRVAKSIAEACGSQSTYQYLQEECARAWERIRDFESTYQHNFMTTFYRLIPTQALLYAKSLIENKPTKDISLEIENNSSYSSSESLVLKIATAFDGDKTYGNTARQILLAATEKGTELPASYRWAYGEYGAFSENSDSDFNVEESKLDLLCERFKETSSDNIATCLLIMIKTLFAARSRRAMQTGNSIEFEGISYKPSLSLAHLHSKCIQASSTFIGTKYESNASSCFRNQFGLFSNECSDEMRGYLSSVLSCSLEWADALTRKDSTANLKCRMGINRTLASSNASILLDTTNFSQCTKDALAIELAKTSTFRGQTAEMPLMDEWTLQRFQNTLAVLIDDYHNQSQWEASQASNHLLLSAAHHLNLDGILSLLTKCATAKLPTPQEAIGITCERFGRTTVRAALKREYMPHGSAIIDSIDAITLNSNPSDDELAAILDELNDGHLHLTLSYIARAHVAHKEFVVDYATAFTDKHTPEETWRFFGFISSKEIQDSILDEFDSSLDTLEKFYLAASESPHFDYDFSLLVRIVSEDRHFAMIFFKHISELPCFNDYDFIRRLQKLWSIKSKEGWIILKPFVENQLSKPNLFMRISMLMPDGEDDVLHQEDFWNMIDDFISKNVSDAGKMRDLSWEFSDCGDAVRARLLTMIFTHDKEGRIIDHLMLRRSSQSGFGDNGFIAAKNNEVTVLENILNALPDELSFLKHRKCLQDHIQLIKKDIKQEQWDLFHERY